MPVISAIVTACDRVAPLWPLTHFVAVNPFVGMSELPFEDAVALVERTSHAQMLPGRSATTRARSVADLVDELTPRAMNGHAFVVDEISKWCSSYFDQGQAVWPMPWRGQSLWSAWKAAASVDANAELMGIAGFRARVACLSDDPVEVITVALAELRVPVEAFDTYLLRLLMSTPGWSGYVQYRVRARQMAGTVSDELTQLLAIRITYDVALHAGTPSIQPAWDDARAQLASSGGGELTQIAERHRLLRDAEEAYQDVVAAAIAGPLTYPTEPVRPDLQAVFCIDVRSEVFRRALEAQSPNIQTIGFAGFFGLSLAYRADPNAPILAATPRSFARTTAFPKRCGSISAASICMNRWRPKRVVMSCTTPRVCCGSHTVRPACVRNARAPKSTRRLVRARNTSRRGRSRRSVRSST